MALDLLSLTSPIPPFVLVSGAPPVPAVAGGTWAINDPGRTWRISTVGRVITLDKRPAWDRVYRANLNDFEEVIAGETLSSPAVDDVTPAGDLTVGTPSVGSGDDDGMILVEIEGGEAGTIYTLTMSAGLSSGGHLDWECRLRVGR